MTHFGWAIRFFVAVEEIGWYLIFCSDLEHLVVMADVNEEEVTFVD